MKKLFFSLVFMLSVGFAFGQAQPLEVTNFTDLPMFIAAGASDNGCEQNVAVTDYQLTQPGGTAVLQPPLGANASWVAFKAVDNFPQVSLGGKFYSPCQQGCNSVDVVISDIEVRWNTANGCFSAQIR